MDFEEPVGRRNLTDIDRIGVARRYEDVISNRMREKQREAASKGGSSYSPITGKVMDKYPEPSSVPTTKRKELAKIAGTSQGSIQRTKLILAEQIERAEKGDI